MDAGDVGASARHAAGTNTGDSKTSAGEPIPERICYQGIVTRTFAGSEDAIVCLLYRQPTDKTNATCMCQIPSLNQVAVTDATMYYRMLLLCTYLRLYRREYIDGADVITTRINGKFNLQHTITQITSVVAKMLYNDLPNDDSYNGPFCTMVMAKNALMLVGKRVKRVFTRPSSAQMVNELGGDTIILRIGGTVRAINALAHEFALAPPPATQLCESCGNGCATNGSVENNDYCSDGHRERDRAHHRDSKCQYASEIHQVRACAMNSASIVERVLQLIRDTSPKYTTMLKDTMAELLAVHKHNEWPPDQHGMTAMREAAASLAECLHIGGLTMEPYYYFYDAVERLCNVVDVGTHEIVIKRMQFPTVDLFSTK